MILVFRRVNCFELVGLFEIRGVIFYFNFSNAAASFAGGQSNPLLLRVLKVLEHIVESE